MDSMENLCRSEARYLMNELEIIVTIQFFDSKYSLANLLQRISM